MVGGGRSAPPSPSSIDLRGPRPASPWLRGLEHRDFNCCPSSIDRTACLQERLTVNIMRQVPRRDVPRVRSSGNDARRVQGLSAPLRSARGTKYIRATLHDSRRARTLQSSADHLKIRFYLRAERVSSNGLNQSFSWFSSMPRLIYANAPSSNAMSLGPASADGSRSLPLRCCLASRL